ncbi:MAG: adenine phosphoribosyltransferase [bacterium]|nr:adenine phosphoribosyltransferase [bacterium]
MNLKDTIRSVPDFPKKGILFRDITTLVKDPEALRCLIDTFADELKEKKIDMVVGPEARGFVLGSALAYALGAGFVLARKPGKLPCETLRYEYSLEYGTDALEIDAGAIRPGMRCVIVDDLLATGGTALATAKLIEQAGGTVEAIRFAMELTDLPGREALAGYDVGAVIQY